MNAGHTKCAGIRYDLRYERERANVVVAPDEIDMAHAEDAQIIAFWDAIADWAVRFWNSNPGWKIDGRKCPEVLPPI